MLCPKPGVFGIWSLCRSESSTGVCWGVRIQARLSGEAGLQLWGVSDGYYQMDIKLYFFFFDNIWWIFLSDGYYWLFVMCLVGPECSPSTSLGLSGACWGLPKAWSVIFSNCWVLTHLQCETPGWFIETGTSDQPLKWIFFAGKGTRSFMTLNNLHQFLWTDFSLCR